jgi:hypothetical protein
MTDARTARPTSETDPTMPAESSNADPAAAETDTLEPEAAADRAAAEAAASEPEAAADRAAAEADTPEPEATADGRSTERLSTDDIGRLGATDREASAGDREASAGEPAHDHRSNIPEPKAAPLFSDDAADELRERWTDVQAGFVDEPKSAVEQADTLVAEVMKRLADSFATERQALEQQWSRGDDASTEDLRVALRRYRSFFDRLLSI